MEYQKRGRGRPKIETELIESMQLSRRATVNAKYMFDGMVLIKGAATKIPDTNLLWNEDITTKSAMSKNGILEQLGRMVEQDRLRYDDCIFFANAAIQSLKGGYTSREIERVLRAVRMAIKRSKAEPDNEELQEEIGRAIGNLLLMR